MKSSIDLNMLDFVKIKIFFLNLESKMPQLQSLNLDAVCLDSEEEILLLRDFKKLERLNTLEYKVDSYEEWNRMNEFYIGELISPLKTYVNLGKTPKFETIYKRDNKTYYNHSMDDL